MGTRKKSLKPCGALVVALAVGLGVLGPQGASADPVLYSINGWDAELIVVDATSGATIVSTPIILPGYTIFGGNGLARHPRTGELWALVRGYEGTSFLDAAQFDGSTLGRGLVTIDPSTGVATLVGDTGINFSGLAFGSDRTLFAVSGDGALNPHSLYTLDTTDATPTYVTDLGVCCGGEALAFNPDDGLLYQASGWGMPNDPFGGELLQTIDPDSLAIANVLLSGDDYGGTAGMTYEGRNAFLYADREGGDSLYRITVGGVVSYIGGMGHQSKGLAFAEPVIRGLKIEALDCPRTLYGLAHQGPDGPSTLYAIEPFTAVPTPVGPVGFERCSGMDFDAEGTLYATCERSDESNLLVLVTIDPLTGIGTEVGPIGSHPFGNTISDISFRLDDGGLYAYLEGGDGVGTIDTATGQLTVLGPSGVSCCGNGIAFSRDDTLFHANEDTLHTLNQMTGQATPVTALLYGPPTEDPRINAMDVCPDTGELFGSLNDGGGGFGPNYLSKVDPATGDVPMISETVPGLDAIAFGPEIVEPGTCGNGRINWKLGETCDPPGSICGSQGNPNWICMAGCQCEFIAYCGDGRIQWRRGEECDPPGAQLAPRKYCDEECQVVPIPYCGNGVVDWSLGEECEVGIGNEFGLGRACDHFSCQCIPAAACCFIDGSCEDLDPEFCEVELGGSSEGPGTSCATVECPNLLEACCFRPGLCEDRLPEDCVGVGGNPQGPGSSCATNPCGSEACCFFDGWCDELTPEFCDDNGGLPQGPGTDCTPNPCLEACCFPDGSCNDLGPGFCEEEAGGFPQGPGTNCATTTCEPEACCLPEMGCVQATLEECVSLDGIPQAAGLTCAMNPCGLITEGCCLPWGLLGACADLVPQSCENVMGIPQGPDTNCATIPDPCPQLEACCASSAEEGGECINTTPEFCVEFLGNLPQGPGTTCAENPCDFETQACCSDDIVWVNRRCIDIVPDSCAEEGDVPQGPGTNCATTACPGQACCFSWGCEYLSLDFCVAVDGDPQGEGTSCTTNPCGFEACCFDWGCEDSLPENCGGDPQGPGSSCATNPCGLDACCRHDGSCEEYTPIFCENVGGIWQGPGTNCATTTCPETEACCSIDGSCQDRIPDSCVFPFGTPQGPGTNCTPNPCPQP